MTATLFVRKMTTDERHDPITSKRGLQMDEGVHVSKKAKIEDDSAAVSIKCDNDTQFKEIEALNQRLKQSELEIESLREQLRQKDLDVKSLKEQLSKKDFDISMLHKMIASLKKRLN